MISRIEGDLRSVEPGADELGCGSLTYTLMVPAADVERLTGLVGERVGFHTLQYLESHGQGSSFLPRLLGFASAEQRAFFELLTTVKGLGMRKALRAMKLPYQSVARAIAGKDVKMLRELPEIGRRTAETMVAELSGKIDRFLEAKPAGGEAEPGLVRDALTALSRLGEPSGRARMLIEQALVDDPSIESADDLVSAAYRARGSDET